ncbi:MAG TPA: hypothetical protein VKG83_06550 [Mycobacterium sp.]|nr:hypothetical protein [Mycobacterium sp.]
MTTPLPENALWQTTGELFGSDERAPYEIQLTALQISRSRTLGRAAQVPAREQHELEDRPIERRRGSRTVAQTGERRFGDRIEVTNLYAR